MAYTYLVPVDTVSSVNLNANFSQAATTNGTPQCVQGDSASLTQMQATVDPQPSQTASLATTLEGELQRIRFVLKTEFGTSQWYTYTDAFVIGPQVSTGSNLAGNSTTLQGGPGTGTGAGGNLIFRVAYPGAAGSTANSQTTVATVNATNNQASGTAALWSLAGTVNQSGTAGYTLLQANATQTATGSGTNNLLDLQVGGVSKFTIDNTGTMTAGTAASKVVNGRLTFSSATLIQFCPYKGNNFYIAKVYTIPSGCITAANTSVTVNGTGASNLGASTTYLVCLFDSSGTLTVDFKTSLTHSADPTTGIETCNATTRVLIGMVRTNASSQFEADASLQGVLSWDNRRGIGLVNGFTTSRTTTSTTYAEVNSEIRANFLTWGDEAVSVSVQGAAGNGTTNSACNTAIGFDGTTAEDSETIDQLNIALTFLPVGLGLNKNGLSEGFHFATVLGAAQTGPSTCTWGGGAVGAVGSGAVRTSLSVGIRG